MEQASTEDENNGGVTSVTKLNVEVPDDTEPNTTSLCGSVSNDSEPVNTVSTHLANVLL